MPAPNRKPRLPLDTDRRAQLFSNVWTRTGCAILLSCGLLAGVLHNVPEFATHRNLIIVTVGITISLGALSWGLHPSFPTRRLGDVAVILLGAGGAILAGWSSFSAIIVGVAALCATTLYGPGSVLTMAGIGIGLAGIAGIAAGDGRQAILSAFIGALAGIVIGIARQERTDRAWRDAELSVAREREVLQLERAALFDERARMAREVHDVLAHTLSALVVQLTAAESVTKDDASDQTKIAHLLGRARQLAADGLEEARIAVFALRDEPLSPDLEIDALMRVSGAAFIVLGEPRQMAPAAGLALVRVAQESLTNSRKHAPGSLVRGHLYFHEGVTILTVTNTLESKPNSTWTRSGGQFGIIGMRERLALVGGELESAPYAGGWKVTAVVPA